MLSMKSREGNCDISAVAFLIVRIRCLFVHHMCRFCAQDLFMRMVSCIWGILTAMHVITVSCMFCLARVRLHIAFNAVNSE